MTDDSCSYHLSGSLRDGGADVGRQEKPGREAGTLANLLTHSVSHCQFPKKRLIYKTITIKLPKYQEVKKKMGWCIEPFSRSAKNIGKVQLEVQGPTIYNLTQNVLH